eukprot:768609-Hanusia_phi.AAC.3
MFGDAPAVAQAIGVTNAFAFDITAACSGFLFATVSILLLLSTFSPSSSSFSSPLTSLFLRSQPHSSSTTEATRRRWCGMQARRSGLTRLQVIGADALSRWVDWEDRNVCVLFGDGAGAMVST